VLGLGRALLREDDVEISPAVDALRAALGATSLVVEQVDDGGVRTSFGSGNVHESHEEHTLPVGLGDEWVGTVSAVFATDPAPLERWALEATADLFGGWIRRGRVGAALARTVEERDRFVATVSHEIRTPLAAVLGLADELRHRFDLLESSEVRELIGLIADQSMEISDIVEDLLALATTDRVGFRVRAEPTRLDGLVRAAIASVPTTARTGLVMRRIESTMAMCDPLRTRQIVRNLVVNAHRHGGDRVFIDVVSSAGADVVVTVADSGNRISDDIQATMFEPYAGTHRTDGTLSSLGLGLTVSRRLARSMGGDLVYRWDGESRFEVHLPGAEPLDCG
jgi:signal transduction histidine kinase